MAKALDFNNIKKRYLPVTLADEHKTVLLIGTPTKSVFDTLLNMKDSLEGDNLSDDAVDELYDVCARIMSRNKAGKVITKQTLQDIFDFEDIIIFIHAYTEFISEVTNAKN